MEILQHKNDPNKLIVRLPGGEIQEITAAQADLIESNPSALENIIGSATNTAKEIYQGGKSLLLPALGIDPGQDNQGLLQQAQEESQARAMQSPISSLVGQALPYVAAGIATSGMGPAGVIGTEAALGAASSPSAPIEGALLGAAGGSLPFLPQAIRAGRGALQPTRMSSRVLQSIQAADDLATTGKAAKTAAQAAPDNQYMKGFATADELDSLGIPTTKGDAASLAARNQDEFVQAQAIRGGEELRRSNPLLGGETNNIRAAQQTGVTEYLKQRVGIPATSGLTPDALSEQIARMGAQFDQHAMNIGSVQIRPVLSQLDDVLEQATATSKSQVSSIINDLKQQSKSTGSITGDQWQQARTRINKMINSGQAQGDIGKLSDGHDLMSIMTDTMERGLTGSQATEIKKLRAEYRLAMALHKGKAMNPSGEVNIATTLNNYNRFKSKRRHQDDIGRVLTTMQHLMARQTPTSGTAERVLNNLPGYLLNQIPGGNLVK